MSRAPRNIPQPSKKKKRSESSSAAHLAVANGDPHGELGRSGATGLLRHCGGGPGDAMPWPGRSPPRAARARERGVERRRGEGDVVVLVLVRRRRRRREEEVERGGAREHLEVDVGGGGGGGATAWDGNGAGDETRGWRRAHEPYHFLALFCPSAVWVFVKILPALLAAGVLGCHSSNLGQGFS